MGRRTYSYDTCRLCGQHVSTNGLARTNHNRKHVREGLYTEHNSPRGCEFTLTDKGREVRNSRVTSLAEGRRAAIGAARVELARMNVQDPSSNDAFGALDDLARREPDLVASKWYIENAETNASQIRQFRLDWYK